MTTYNLALKQAYNFVLKAPSILGLGYTNATVMALMDYDSAKSISDILSLHNAAYPLLTEGTPRNAKDLTYIKLKTTSGEIRVIAMEWIASEPVLITSQTIRVTISNVAMQDTQLIKDILIQNGFPNLTIEVLSN